MKFREIFEERTKSYRFTHKPGNPLSELKMKQLKNEIKSHNDKLKEDPNWSSKHGAVLNPEWRGRGFGDKYTAVPLRIVKQGRLGKDNPKSELYKYDHPDRDGRRPRRGSYGGPQRINVDDATRFDVYVHNRYPDWKKDKD